MKKIELTDRILELDLQAANINDFLYEGEILLMINELNNNSSTDICYDNEDKESWSYIFHDIWIDALKEIEKQGIDVYCKILTADVCSFKLKYFL